MGSTTKGGGNPAIPLTAWFFFLEYLRKSLRMGEQETQKGFQYSNLPSLVLWHPSCSNISQDFFGKKKCQVPQPAAAWRIDFLLAKSPPGPMASQFHRRATTMIMVKATHRGPSSRERNASSWGRLRAKRNTRPITRSALSARKIEVSYIPYLQDPKDWSTWIPMKDSDHPQHSR